MRLFKYFKKKKEEKEYLRWLYGKVRVGVSPPSDIGRLPHEPPPRKPPKMVPKGTHEGAISKRKLSRISCPGCHSRFIRYAGYSGRFECQDWGHVFS